MKFDRLIPAKQFKAYWNDIRNILNDCDDKHKKVHIVFEPEKRVRSTGYKSQSHHLNGHIQQIAAFTGQPFEDIKKYIKQQAISMGYPILERMGNPVLDLWGNPMGISEADSTTEQCGFLIEQAHILAAELNITLIEDENDN